MAKPLNPPQASEASEARLDMRQDLCALQSPSFRETAFGPGIKHDGQT